ncbi:hypothetical protein COB57_05715 [Candidatus Peregrinibacteria bacterium]|nr:MAG: hypothetical protein COB57_05715 [Candidatus Peregrinibacteria bacterium]
MKQICASLLAFFLFTNASYAAITFENNACVISLEENIKTAQTNFFIDFEIQLNRSSYKSETLADTKRSLQQYACELDQICEGINAFSTPEGKKGSQSYTCQSLYPSQSEKLNIPENSTCHINSIETSKSLAQLSQWCQLRISTEKNTLLLYSQEQYKNASRQEEIHFFSAHLLQLNDLFQEIGLLLEKVGNSLRKIFRSIYCQCSE